MHRMVCTHAYATTLSKRDVFIAEARTHFSSALQRCARSSEIRGSDQPCAALHGRLIHRQPGNYALFIEFSSTPPEIFYTMYNGLPPFFTDHSMTVKLTCLISLGSHQTQAAHGISRLAKQALFKPLLCSPLTMLICEELRSWPHLNDHRECHAKAAMYMKTR